MKRFWKEVAARKAGHGWQVLLDGRAIKTQGGNPQLLPTRALADLVVAEFAVQGEEVDPKAFVHRDLADYALDVLSRERAETVAQLLQYAETDTLCYRAEPGEPLFARQEELWEPLLSACEARHGVTLTRASGIVHRPQPKEAMAALGTRLEAESDFTLAALVMLTSLAASLVVGLALLEDGADVPALFAAANAEQDWQAELWGWDFAAKEAREMKLAAFEQAAEFLRAVRS